MDFKSAETMDFNLALDYTKQEYAKSYGEEKFLLHDVIVFMLRYKEMLEKQPQIVRCEKCKHRHLTGICVNIDGACFRNYVADDFFCANGERRMDDGRY